MTVMGEETDAFWKVSVWTRILQEFLLTWLLLNTSQLKFDWWYFVSMEQTTFNTFASWPVTEFFPWRCYVKLVDYDCWKPGICKFTYHHYIMSGLTELLMYIWPSHAELEHSTGWHNKCGTWCSKTRTASRKGKWHSNQGERVEAKSHVKPADLKLE